MISLINKFNSNIVVLRGYYILSNLQFLTTSETSQAEANYKLILFKLAIKIRNFQEVTHS